MSTVPHRLGKYEFQRFLGKGNIGEVWKARDLANKRDVALKIVYADLQRSDPQFLTRFMTDGQVLVSLRHTNLVSALEVNIIRQEQSNEITAYIAMDYIVGQTFANYIQNTSHTGNFPPLSAMTNFFTSLGLALDYAYQREIVHGNLTPDNILLDQQDTAHFPGGEPMLTDIGLTQILGLVTNTYTKAPFYLSPEQAQGYPPSQRSDVYELGIILYEIYTGTLPFRRESSTAIMSQHIRTLPTPPALINPIIPTALSEVILRAIAKDPITRFATVSAFAAAISDASTIQPSYPISEQLPRIDSTTTGASPMATGPVRQENSLLGVAQPPSLSGTSQFRFSSGKPSLSGLTSKEISGQMPAIHSIPSTPSIPAPLPTQPQPMVTKPLPLEANNVVPSPTKPETPTVQPQQISVPTSEPIEPKKPDAHTQAIPLSSIAQAHQTYTSNPDENAPKPVNTPYPQSEQRLPVPQAWQTPQLPPLSPPSQSQQTYTPNPNINTSQSVNTPYSHSDQPIFNVDYTDPSSASARKAAQVSQKPQTTPLSQPVQPISALSDSPKRKKPLPYTALIALLALIIIGGTLGAILLFNKGNTSPVVPGNSNNRAFFQDGSLHNDQLRLDLPNVAPPPDGQTYFGWLEDTSLNALPLGALPVQNGSISFLYQGDSKHTNLISITQGILITTEDIGKTPRGPSDHKVYQASFDPQLLDGLKYLLYATPGLPNQQSIVATILDTLHSIDDKAGSIVETLNHDNAQVIRQATRIIELLDNSQQAQKTGDLPDKYPLQQNVTIGLLSSPSQQGYLDILDAQLQQMQPLVAHNANAQQHLINVKSALSDLRDWLQKMHDYDVQLLKAADLQNPGISGIALQLKQVSADSFTGRTLPPNASPQPIAGSAGAQQAYTEAQYMATLFLQPV